MTFLSLFSRRFCRFNTPVALLLALLQRTPVLRLATAVEEYVAASPVSALLRSSVALATMGTMHSLVGATQLFVSPSDATATVGVAKTFLFTVTGAPVAPASWMVPTAPAGMTFSAYPSGVQPDANRAINASTIQLTGTPTTTGTFNFTLQAWQLADRKGDTLSYSYTITVSSGPPIVTVQPRSFTAGTGGTVALTVAGTGVSTYQWRKEGAAIAGATSDTLIFPAVTAASAGSYTAVLTNAVGSVTSSAGQVAVTPGLSRISNLSVRTNLASSQTLTVGFVASGAKTLLLRGVGPTLVSFGFPNAYPDPKIVVQNSTGVIDSNDNWAASLAPTFVSIGAFSLVNGSKDAALSLKVTGPNTAAISGIGSGVLLVEVYDQDSVVATRLTNVSALNQVGTGADVLVTGFVIAGPVAKTVLIRGVGPTLKASPFGISTAMDDPRLDVFDEPGTKIGENDNWNAALAPYFSSVGAFGFGASSKDSAVLITLAPGAYTAQVSGINGGTGLGIVEVYEVP